METIAIGPDYFKGKYPFETKVIIETKLKSGIVDQQFITCVGFKKPGDEDFDFVEMIPAFTQAEAQIVHEKTCRFFSNSSLFRKIETGTAVCPGMADQLAS